jgi:hypothetical protein
LTTEAVAGSTNATPVDIATATRSSWSTRMPGSEPSEIAVSILVRVSPVPGSPRTTSVPGLALASCDT